MTVSVIIPVREGEDYQFKLVGAGEVLPIKIGTRTEARNIGAQWAIYDEFLFLDNDMDISNVDLRTLNSYNFDIATAFYQSYELHDLNIVFAQNWQALVGSPSAFYGGFMYVRRPAFEHIGPFTERFMEDVEYGTRATTKGYHINVFPFGVLHTRRFSGPSLAKAVSGIDPTWGIAV